MTNLQLLNVNMLYYFCIWDFTEVWIGVVVVKDLGFSVDVSEDEV